QHREGRRQAGIQGSRRLGRVERHVGNAAGARRQHGARGDQGFREAADAGRGRLSRAGARGQTEPHAGFFASRGAPNAQTAKGRDSLSNRNRDQGIGQTASRTSRGRGARLPLARALQGQGCALFQRAGDPERNEEEVGTAMIDKKAARLRRASQTRRKIRELAKVQLAVHRTNTHIYAQLRSVDGKVLTYASTMEKEVRTAVPNGGNKAAAVAVGRRIAEKAKGLGIEAVAFDRSGYKYHGRVK